MPAARYLGGNQQYCLTNRRALQRTHTSVTMTNSGSKMPNDQAM